MIKGLILSGLASLMLASPTIKQASQTTVLDVTTSTVEQDLRAFYNDVYPENTLAYLVPSTLDGDRYSDFKFLTMYAYQGDLYVYLYVKSYSSFDSVSFEYSDSTNLSEDETEINETYSTVALDVMSTNGSYNSFYKCVANDFYTYTEGSSHRVLASKITLKNEESMLTMTRTCESAEYSWQDQASGEDQVYTYYKDNYLVISQAEVVQQHIVTKWIDSAMTRPSNIQENNWLFFDYDYSSLGYDYSFGKLKSIRISFEYLTYLMSYRVSDYNGMVYTGAYQKADSFIAGIDGASDASFTSYGTTRNEVTITPATKTIDKVTYDKTRFFIWNTIHSINYTYTTIQKLDDTSVSAIGDSDFKSFISANRDDYRYAVDFKEDDRWISSADASYNNPWDVLRKCVKAESICHEASAVSIVSLTFETEDGDCNLNAIMDPVDTSSVITTTPATTTVHNFISEEVTSNLTNALKIAAIVAGAALLSFGIINLIKFIRGRKR